MAKKKAHHEEHIDETWLIPYADMLTLLLALFIVMFAMSQVDKEKLRKISQQFSVIFSSQGGVLQNGGTNVVPAETSGSSDIENGAIEQDKMAKIQSMLEQEIKSKGYEDKVKVSLTGEGLEIAIQDTVLFNSGDAEILKDFSPILIQVSKMLKNLDNEIRFAGYTDNVPINNEKFHSNWDLSYARAANVMNFMVNAGQLSSKNLSIQAYGENKAKYDNSTEEGRTKNRRVEILIARKYPVNSKINKIN